MTVQDISNGPYWIMWGVFALLAVISIVLLSGRGAWLIAGYNTSGKAEKAKYNEKKMCRIMGVGMAVLAVFVFIMAMWGNVLPAYFVYIFLAVTLIDTAVMIILTNTICKK